MRRFPTLVSIGLTIGLTALCVGRVLTQGDSTGPLVVGNVVVVTGNTAGAGDGGVIKEAAPENVRGFDAKSGKLLWTFHVVPNGRAWNGSTSSFPSARRIIQRNLWRSRCQTAGKRPPVMHISNLRREVTGRSEQ